MSNEALELFSFLFSYFRKMPRKQSGCFLHNLVTDSFQVEVFDDFKTISMFVRAMKTIKKTASIDSGRTHISVVMSSNKEYVTVRVERYKRCVVKFHDSGKIDIFGSLKQQDFSIMFFSDRKIFFKVSVPKERWIPANLKTFGFMPKYLKNTIFSYMAQKNLLWKDLLQYSYYPPISLDLISESHTVKELLEKRFKISLPRSANKKSLNAVYAACCAVKYTPESQMRFLFMVNTNESVQIGRTQKVTGTAYIRDIIYERLHIDDSKTSSITVINDYINMAVIGNEKIDLLKGVKTYKKRHDELLIKHRYKQNKVKLIIPETQLSKIELPNDFIRITTTEQLIEESVKNNNCVWSYALGINKGRCLIYTLDYNGEHCTIELRYSRKKYRICQMSKANNMPVSAKTREYVDSVLISANETAHQRR